MASGVTRVIERCENAMETQKLDLSECQLLQMPDAVFHLMRNTIISECNLSKNVISRLPIKLAEKFSQLKVLDISFNRIGKLPEEIIQLKNLQHLNMSNNALIDLPSLVYNLPNLEILQVSKNFIEDIDIPQLASHEKLKTIDLRDNPLSSEFHSQISSAAEALKLKSKILFTPSTSEDEL